MPLRKSIYDMGKMIEDKLIVQSDNPMEDDSKPVKKQKRKDKSKAKKSKSIFTLPKFGRD
jgi:hypothetical protein